MDADSDSFAMPGQALPIDEHGDPGAAIAGSEDAAIADYVVHTWEAPTCVSACCEGKFASHEVSCAFAQQGGVAFLDASNTGISSLHEMHCYDRIDNAKSIRAPGAYLLLGISCFVCVFVSGSCRHKVATSNAGMSRDILLIRTRDLTFTLLSPNSASEMEEVHSTQLGPEAVEAGTGTRPSVMSQPALILTEPRDGGHYSIFYLAVATTVSIFLLDLRIQVGRTLPLNC